LEANIPQLLHMCELCFGSKKRSESWNVRPKIFEGRGLVLKGSPILIVLHTSRNVELILDLGVKSTGCSLRECPWVDSQIQSNIRILSKKKMKELQRGCLRLPCTCYVMGTSNSTLEKNLERNTTTRHMILQKPWHIEYHLMYMCRFDYI
jgi:hypothetical protein